jgi:flagellar basal-body rod protein FlgG
VIYGLYQSAAGIQSSSYRQDVIANNIANAETAGFKRDIALFDERLTEAQARRNAAGSSRSDPLLENIGGGLFAHPTLVDTRQGDLEPTGNPLDVAIEGKGFFLVQNAKGEKFLTRNGQFSTDRAGNLILANTDGDQVLDEAGRPIRLPLAPAGALNIARDGTISAGPKPIARLGLYDVDDAGALKKQGETLIAFGNQPLKAGTAVLRAEFIERSNVDPTTELAELMDTQRQLEANANMIRYQDQTLGRLVNEVGKIG